MLGRTNTGGGGGGSLNFQVVGNPQPTNPKKNTIWLNTDVPINGFDFNATEPTNPVQGMAWISIGNSSPVAFNALKKNGVMVYPISAKQYIDGAWIAVTAKSYQGGEWVAWVETYMVNDSTFTARMAYTGSYSRGTYSFSDDGYYGKIAGAYKDASFVTKEKVDFTNIRQISAPYLSNPTSGNFAANARFMLCIASGNESLSSGYSAPIAEARVSDASKGTLVIDTSEIKGEYYIWIVLCAWGDVTCEATVGNLSFYR